MKFYNDRRSNLYYYRVIINLIKVIFYCLLYHKTIPNIIELTSNLIKDFRKRSDYKANIFWDIIVIERLTAIHNSFFMVRFYKNGRLHNSKNAAVINDYGYREFRLNGNWYNLNKIFTKESWRRFVKLQTFL